MNSEIKKRITQIKNDEIPDGYNISKIGIIPADWEISKMNDVFTRIIRKNDENNQNNLTISALEGLVSQEEYFNKQIASKDNMGYYLLKKGEFAYNKSYSNGYPMGAIKRLDQYDKGVVSTLYICFAIKDKSDSDFFTHYFENGNLNREIYKIAQEGARNHGLLNMSVSEFFSDMQLVLPSKKERDKIATILSTQEKIIKLKEKLLAEKKRQKKYLMQVLLNPDSPDFKRLPEFSGEWEKVKVKEIIEKSVGGGTPSTKRNEYWKGTLPWISSSDLSEEGISRIEANRFITEEAVMDSATKKVPTNSIVVVTRVGLGKIGVSNYPELYTSQDFNSLLLKSTANPVFVAYHIKNIILRGFNQGSTIKGITKNDLLNMIFPFPLIKEQNKIIQILSIAEKSIANIQQELEQQKKKKKALMQLLLTGKVKVKV